VTAGAVLVFAVLRDLPLTPAEHQVVLDLASRARRHRWTRVEDLDLAGLEGFGRHRAVLRFRLRRPDLELAELPRVAELLGELCAAVPAGELLAGDPLALFGQTQGAITVEGRWLLPALPEGWAEPARSRLEGGSPEGVTTPLPPPATEAELADLLEVVDLEGATPAMLAAGATGATRHLPALRAALFGGTRPGAACKVFATLADRGLADHQALLEGARAVLGDGDARERAGAAALHEALGGPARSPAAADNTDWGCLSRLGRALLQAPGLLPVKDDTTGSVSSTDWEDDLDLGALAEDPDDRGALQARLVALEEHPDRLAAVSLAQTPSFPGRAAARLGADDAAAAGAAALLAMGTWPLRHVPGWFGALASLAVSSRPWPLRGLALRALAVAGGPDATEVLLGAATWQEIELAGEAVRALALVPGAQARSAVRSAAARADLVADALIALADAGDVAGLELAERALDGPDLRARRVAASVLDQLGGSRAVARLERVLAEDPADAVRRAAAQALARVAPADRVGRLLLAPDADLVAGVLRALGEAGRAELGDRVQAAARHRDPGVRAAAAQALGLLELTGCTPQLLGMLLDEDAAVGLAALEALTLAGDARAVRLLRLLAGHPGSPGQRATRVLAQGRRLRLPAPDARIRVLARADHSLASKARARMTAAFAGVGLEVHVGELGLAAEGELAPTDLLALDRLLRAIAATDDDLGGLSWSVRDAQGLLRRVDGAWRLCASGGELPREGGWFRAELPAGARVPLRAEERLLPPDPGMVDALPVGLGDDEGADLDELLGVDDREEVNDDATEQTISAFLEEVTGQASPEEALAAAQGQGEAAQGQAALGQAALGQAALGQAALGETTRRVDAPEAPAEPAPPAEPVSAADPAPGGPPPRKSDRAARSTAPPARPRWPISGGQTVDGLEELLFDPDHDGFPPRH